MQISLTDVIEETAKWCGVSAKTVYELLKNDGARQDKRMGSTPKKKQFLMNIERLR